MKPKILLVCDASRQRGSGHVMRMITLGSSLADAGADVDLSAHEYPESMVELAGRQGIKVILREVSQASRRMVTTIPPFTYRAIVFDGYDFDHLVFEELSGRGEHVVVIDDNGDHAGAHCQVIVNSNLHASAAMYSSNTCQPALLLGTEYALIRPEIRTVNVAPIRERNGVLLSLGGTDVLGRRDEMEQHLRRHRPWLIRRSAGVTGQAVTAVAEMTAALAASRVGLIAVGTTTWEALYVGLPIVGVIVADNQLLVARSLSEAGLASSFDLRRTANLDVICRELSDLYDSERVLHERSERGRALVDGQGADRLARILLDM